MSPSSICCADGDEHVCFGPEADTTRRCHCAVCCREMTVSICLVTMDIHGGKSVKASCESLVAVFDCDIPPNDFARLPASRAFFLRETPGQRRGLSPPART